MRVVCVCFLFHCSHRVVSLNLQPYRFCSTNIVSPCVKQSKGVVRFLVHLYVCVSISVVASLGPGDSGYVVR